MTRKAAGGDHGAGDGRSVHGAAPRQRRAFSTIGGPVESGGDPDLARLLAGLYRVDEALGRVLTHGFHSYAGRMHPSIARGAVARLSRPGDLVVDPFCGSGTVVVEALWQERRVLGIDASPLAVAIAKTRATLLGESGRARLVETAARIAENSAERAHERQRPAIPAWAAGERGRFHPHVALELFGLRELVMAEPDDDIGLALRMCLSSILVKVMRAGPEAPRDGAEKRIAPGVPSRLFADRARELGAGLDALERVTPPGTPPARIEAGDARNLRGALGDGVAALVCSSPPYAGTYDYAAQHDARFTWLGLPRAAFEKTQIGGRTHGLGPGARAFHADRARWLGEMARILRPGGRAFLVVGDGVVGDAPERAHDAVAAAATAAGLVPLARASQARPIRDRRLAEIFAGHRRQEHLLLLGKP